MNLKDLKDKVTRGKLSEAIKAVIEWAEANDGDLENSARLVSSRIYSLEQQVQMDTVPADQARTTRNKISKSLFWLIDEIADHEKYKVPSGSSVVPPIVVNTAVQNNPSAEPQKNASGKKIFFSYAREDFQYLQQLKKHLSSLKRRGLISTWADSNIKPGQDWSTEIENNLREADIIVLMVSVDFLSSAYIYDYEIPWALEQKKQKKATIIPLILRESDWTSEIFQGLQAIPQDPNTNRLVPLANWENQDAGYVAIVKALKRLIET
ncbi:MAG: TIR domain-containing protein [Bacteroidota bacterium]